MADFCNQCAKELGLPEGDFKNFEVHLNPGEVLSVICEGCGPTYVNSDGDCAYHAAAGGTSKACYAASMAIKLDQVVTDQVADWCTECNAPQYVTGDGAHHCGEAL